MQDLEVFLVVLRRGSFAAAAGELGVSRSAVSRTVARLEARVGVSLLNRTTRSMSPTEAGSRLADGARGPLAALAALQDGLASDRLRGPLRVAAPLGYGIQRVLPAVESFLARQPDVQLDISYDDRMLDLTSEGIDIAIRGGALPDSTLVAQRLGPLEVGLYGRSDGPLVDAIAHPDDLREVPMLLHRRGPLTMMRGRSRVVVDVKPRLVCRSTRARVSAARAGLGLALLPGFADLAGLAPVLPTWSLAPGRLGLFLLRPPGQPAPRVRALWSHLATELSA